MKEHRHAEIFWGLFNCFESWGWWYFLNIYIFVYIYLQPRPTTTKLTRPIKCCINTLSFFSYITSQISVPKQTLSSCFCPPDSLISSAPFLSLLEQMLNVDLLFWVCLNKNMPTLLLPEYFRLPEDTEFIFSLHNFPWFLLQLPILWCIFCQGGCVSFSFPSTCILKNNGAKNQKQVGFLHWTPFGGPLSQMTVESWE